MAPRIAPASPPVHASAGDLDYLKSWIACRSTAEHAGPPRETGQLEQFLTHVFNKSKDGISIHALDFTIVGVNTTMRDWYAHARPLVGRKCFEAYHGRQRPCPGCPAEAAVRTGQPQLRMVPYQVSGRSLGDQELSTFPLFDDDRQLLCVLEYVRDVTSLHRDARIVENLKRRIQLQEHTLHEQETALQVLLRQAPKVEERIGEEIALNLEALVLPLVARLKANCIGQEPARDLAVLEQRLVEIASARSGRLSRALRTLSAREREVALLVRLGRTSKEIAGELRITAKSVEFHRTNIRRKLGLAKAGGSLQAELLELEHPSSTLG
jgi:DNA-binding CsgD family transcriptional regulator